MLTKIGLKARSKRTHFSSNLAATQIITQKYGDTKHIQNPKVKFTMSDISSHFTRYTEKRDSGIHN